MYLLKIYEPIGRSYIANKKVRDNTDFKFTTQAKCLGFLFLGESQKRFHGFYIVFHYHIFYQKLILIFTPNVINIWAISIFYFHFFLQNLTIQTS